MRRRPCSYKHTQQTRRNTDNHICKLAMVATAHSVPVQTKFTKTSRTEFQMFTVRSPKPQTTDLSKNSRPRPGEQETREGERKSAHVRQRPAAVDRRRQRHPLTKIRHNINIFLRIVFLFSFYLCPNSI
jgi:hypothetical protein